MVTTVNFSDFVDTFRNIGRAGQFGYNAQRALFDWLEEYEDGTDEQLELDVIALCVEWTEYDNLEEVQESYNDIKSLEDLQDQTTVLQLPGDGLLVMDY